MERVPIHAFILAMLVWMIFWDAAPANPVKKYVIPKLAKIFLWLGLGAQWRMFSPDPPDGTIWPMVKMTMQNGDVVRWEPTPYAALTVLEKMRFKRFHKFFYEVTRPRSDSQLKRDLMQYLLARLPHGQTCTKAELYLVARATPPFDAPSSDPQPQKKLLYTLRPAAEQKE